MILKELIDSLKLKIEHEGNLNTEISEGHVGDLLSQVMSDAKENSIWITCQTHQNIIAVAEVVGIKAIVIPDNYKFTEDTLNKVKETEISLLSSNMSGFNTAGVIFKTLNL